MGILGAITAFLVAATTFLKVVWPTVEARKILREIEAYEDEITELADFGSPADKLRLEVLAKRRDRAVEQLRALRSAYRDPATRD